MANVDAPDDAGPGAAVPVQVVFSPVEREVLDVVLTLPAGATVADALRATGWPDVAPLAEGLPCALVAAVWGRVCGVSQAVLPGDRVEVLRPLSIDPMQARRARFEAAGGVKELRRRRQALQPRKRGA